MLADTWNLLSLHIQSWGQWQCIFMHMYMNGYKYIMETYELDHIYTIFSIIKKH